MENLTTYKKLLLVTAFATLFTGCANNNYSQLLPFENIAPIVSEDGIYFYGVSSNQSTKDSAFDSAMDDALRQLLFQTGMEVSQFSQYVYRETNLAYGQSTKDITKLSATNYLSIARIEERKVSKSRHGDYDGMVKVFIDNVTLSEMKEWSTAIRENKLNDIKNPYIYITGLGTAVKHEPYTDIQIEQQALRSAKLDAYSKLSESRAVHTYNSSSSENGVLTKDTKISTSLTTIKKHELVSEDVEWSGEQAIAKVVLKIPRTI